MKNLTRLSILFFSILVFAAFDSDPKLTQERAKNAIGWFVIDQYIPDFTWRVVMIEMGAISQVNKSSETQASCTAVVEARVATGDPTKECSYTDTKLTIEFYFEKNKDDKWIFRGISKCTSKVKVNEDNLKKFIEKYRDLNIAVD